MCGRFVQTREAENYGTYFLVDVIRTDEVLRSWNVAPTKQVYAVAEHEGERQLGTFDWGLLPFWAKDRKIGARLINARVETAAEKPAFRDSFTARRCIIPAEGFYEWEPKDRGKLPHYFFASDGRPLALAGLWSSWKDPDTDDRVRTCTILTTDADNVVEPIHERMPVILPRTAWDPWLDTEITDAGVVGDLLAGSARPDLVEHAVSTLVNRVANDVPELITPLETGAV
ncbi:MAG: SOS response-associated peptidase [Actinomycetota bacterium]|nr:SOS response-associated peptidase [Actinomycetota bacterium]